MLNWVRAQAYRFWRHLRFGVMRLGSQKSTPPLPRALYTEPLKSLELAAGYISKYQSSQSSFSRCVCMCTCVVVDEARDER